MSVVAEFKGTITPLDVPSEIIDKWATTLTDRRALIYSRLMTKIPDETAFKDKIASPSHEVWRTFVNPAFADYYLILLKQNIKISIAHPRWKVGVIDAFSVGGRFETGVDLKKDRLAQLKYTLGNVGIRYLGWKPGYKAVGYITGDLRVKRYIEAGETVVGEPVNAFPEEYVKFVRPTLIAMLTQGAVLSLYAHENGLSALRDQVITLVNAKTDAICSGLKKAEYTLVYARLEYDPAENKIFVHSRVEM